MARLHELREQRATKVGEMRALVTAAEAGKRDLADNERERFDALKGEVSGLDVRISQAETLADFERRADAEPVNHHGGHGQLEQRYSIARAVTDILATGRLTGVEAEWTAEHRKANRQGGGIAFAAPVSAFLGTEQRYIGTTQPSAGPGGNLLSTSLGPLIDRPRPQLQVQALGATVLTGLTDNLDLPRLKASGSVGWVGEHQNGTKSDPQFDKVSMGPKTVSGTYEMSRRMMIQAPQIEQILRNDIGLIIAGAIDLAAVRGTGTGNAPRGIKSTPGVRKVTATGIFATPNEPTVAELDKVFGTMMGLVDASDIAGNAGWLTNPRVNATYNRYRDGNGNLIQGLWGNEQVRYSTQVPANGGAGTNLAEVYYSGNWADLIIGYWSSVDIVLNPYHPDVALNGGALLHAFLDCDVGVRHPEGFTYFDALPVTALASTTTA